jgi:hypothetical protein
MSGWLVECACSVVDRGSRRLMTMSGGLVRGVEVDECCDYGSVGARGHCCGMVRHRDGRVGVDHWGTGTGGCA